jgi:hypothetical protein
MKDYLLPFAVAFVVCGMLFLGLDYTIMKLMGLTLIFQP